MSANAETIRPVKKSNWGIGMAVLYGSFAVFILGMVFYSVSNPVDLVEENYYEQELLYQEQLNSIRRTKALPVGLEVRYIAARDQVTLTFPEPFADGTKGTVTFFRPSDSRLDHMIDLALNEHGEQLIEATGMASGMWRLIVSWQLDGQEYFDEEILVLK